MYAPIQFYKWKEIVAEYNLALTNPNDMKVFVNTILGETWAEASDAPKFENLYNRREGYHLNFVPKEVCFLTCGVDVQKDRLELEIVGWCKDKQSYSIDYRVLVGQTALPDVWNELEKVVYETWTREDGLNLNIMLMAVDSSAYTSEVYAWCRKFPVSKVIPIKGMDNLKVAYRPPVTLDVNIKGKKIGKVKVWGVGVSYLKEELYSWLNIEKQAELYPPCYCHFPEGYDQHYFKSLTAEDWIPAKKKWHKRYERNEALDVRIYARAASVVVGLDRLKPEQLEVLCGVIQPIKPRLNKDFESIW